METIRTFVALRFDEQTNAELERFIGELRRSYPDVKWAPAENLHLTLVFLGDVHVNDLNGITEALAEVGREFDPYWLSLRAIGCFPKPARARIVWVGCDEGSDETTTLQDLIATQLEPFGYRRENRPYRPHVTIGRAKGRHPLAFDHGVRKWASWHGGPTEITEICTMGSQLGRHGPTYSVLARCPLGQDD
ncbi:2'-5'-RNA ligase [Planctomycetes bacterium Pan216]|uniref:RNA 2',3'-cyclic phosphodiesterase n=1 Tax=Kolteria novifilia TaxID=2527975 RepID=A0A518BCI2_9BACT|nr:2'-5'-RNA ligase [Planctomycetes bacterium Pan216]